MPSPFIRLIYASRTVPSMTTEDLAPILKAARHHNASHAITGMLCYGNGRFLQYIEGERAEVNALYARIMADRRHYGLVLLDYSPIAEPNFAEWSMGFVDSRDDGVRRILSESADMEKFLPEEMSSFDAVRVVERLKLHIMPQFEVLPDDPEDQERTTVN